MNVNRFMPLTHIVIQIILKSNKMSSLGNPNGNHRPLIVSKDRFLIGLVGQIGVQIPILYPLRFERMLTMSFLSEWRYFQAWSSRMPSST
jgi:hypothetical protein